MKNQVCEIWQKVIGVFMREEDDKAEWSVLILAFLLSKSISFF